MGADAGHDKNQFFSSAGILICPLIMEEQLYTIDEFLPVTDIVAADYRSADVFKKYDIEFCCGGRWPLHVACEARGLDTRQVIKELQEATRVIHVSPSLPFNEWPLDFLADYIRYVHHAYLVKALPGAKEHLDKFAEGHRKKFPYLDELQRLLSALSTAMLPHLRQEEDIIFPYIKRLSRTAVNKEPYGGLLVRTLRKPIEEIMHHEHGVIGKILRRFRELTDKYTAPEKACISHRVTFARLREIDNDLVQHIHLENNILFPRAIAIEKELLHKSGD